MRLKIFVPSKILIDCDVVKVVAEAPNGSFGILPQHIDFVAALVPGVLMFTDADGKESFVGIDEGILLKRGGEVMVSTVDASQGDDLSVLRETVRQRQENMNDHERSARSALARLEAGVVKRFMQFQE